MKTLIFISLAFISADIMYAQDQFVLSEFTVDEDAITTISGNVSYDGNSTGPIYVLAFIDPNFCGGPTAYVELGSPGDYAITGLADGSYYVISVMVTGGPEAEIEMTDPWGVYGTLENPTPVTITGGSGQSGIDIVLVDGTEENPNPFYEGPISPDQTTVLPEITQAGWNPSITSDGSSIYLYKHDYEGAPSAKIFEINPYSGDITATYNLTLNNLADGISFIDEMTWYEGSIWAEGGYGDPSGAGLMVGIFKIDLTTSQSSNQILAGPGIDLGGAGLGGLASDGINFYIGVDLKDVQPDIGIVKFDPRQVSEVPTSPFFPLDEMPEYLSYGDEYLWAGWNGIKKIDPSSGIVVMCFDLPTLAAELYLDGMLWMYDDNDNTLKAFTPEEEAGIEEEMNTPHPIRFYLLQNYPNPFNLITTISYELPKSAFVNLSIYNVKGQLVETIVNEHNNPGFYTIEWNTSRFGSGIYFYRIKAGEYRETKKCVILK